MLFFLKVESEAKEQWKLLWLGQSRTKQAYASRLNP